jgi:hypothetical protein
LNRRNWLQIDRKLVDGTDLDYSFNAVQRYMAQNNLAFFGQGVLTTTTYTAPFPVSISSVTSGTVGTGIAYDPTGLQIRIDDGSGTFAIEAADQADRFDLLVLRYKAKGSTLIPEPDKPTVQVYLNIVDGFELAVIKGGANYPAKGQFDVILAGLKVKSGASSIADVVVDLSIREIATPLRAFFPTFKQEALGGTIDGTNQSFTLSATPLNATSVIVSVNGLALHSSDWALSGQTVTLNDAPAPGQDVYAYYVVNAAGTINPVAGFQEVPSGATDGANPTFVLSNEPVDQASMQVYVDGIVVPITQWTLNQSPQLSSITFNAGAIPQPGQDVYAFYLLNAVAVSQTGGQAQSGSQGGGAVSLSTEYPQLSGDDLSNGFVQLANTPSSPNMVLLDVIGGSAQAYGSDFTVAANKLYWAGDFASSLGAGDRFRIHYAY